MPGTANLIVFGRAIGSSRLLVNWKNYQGRSIEIFGLDRRPLNASIHLTTRYASLRYQGRSVFSSESHGNRLTHYDILGNREVGYSIINDINAKVRHYLFDKSYIGQDIRTSNLRIQHQDRHHKKIGESQLSFDDRGFAMIYQSAYFVEALQETYSDHLVFDNKIVGGSYDEFRDLQERCHALQDSFACRQARFGRSRFADTIDEALGEQ